MTRRILESLILMTTLASATQAPAYGTYTILSLYSKPGCAVGSGPTSLTPTNTIGNCTNLDSTYGLEIAQLGTGCNVQLFQRRDCPSGSFAEDAFLNVCNGFNGALVESVRLTDCENALPGSSSGSGTTSSAGFGTTSSAGSGTTSSAGPTTTSNAGSGAGSSGTSSNDTQLSVDKIVGIVVGVCMVIATIIGITVAICCGGIGNVLTWLGLRQRSQTDHTERLGGNTSMAGTYNRSGNRVGRDYYSGPTTINNWGRE